LRRASALQSHLRLAACSSSSQGKPPIKAVIFDMGGVLIPSPGSLFKGLSLWFKFWIIRRQPPVFSDVERSMQLPAGTMLRAILDKGEQSAWAEYERGQISEDEFGKKFSAECSKQVLSSSSLFCYIRTF
jgi:acyl-CoA dehydrogenase family protein 10